MLNILDNYPLSKLTTLQIGGPAKKFVAVKTQEDLIEAIRYAKENNLKYKVIGGGSNLLVSDQGIDILIIKNEITGTERDNQMLKVKSGTSLQELVNYSIDAGLAGLQKLAGIPGTVGGAIFGNAGAYGQSISNHLTHVIFLNPNNLTIQQFNNSHSSLSYRDSAFKKSGNIILEASFNLQPGDSTTLKQDADEIIAKRAVRYPPGIKCPGSFFKNIIALNLSKEILDNIPKEKIVFGKIPAGTLLEAVGAKGDRLGDIQIASYHGNLFINKGNGTASDFYNLAKKYHQKVKEKFGIALEPEVQLINLPPL